MRGFNNSMNNIIRPLTFQNISKNKFPSLDTAYTEYTNTIFINALLRNIILSLKILSRFGGNRGGSSYQRWSLKVDESKRHYIRDLALIPRRLYGVDEFVESFFHRKNFYVHLFFLIVVSLGPNRSTFIWLNRTYQSLSKNYYSVGKFNW